MIEKAISVVTVGVRDMNQAVQLWGHRFGLYLIDRRSGPDEGLAKLWDLGPERIVEQVYFETPGADCGRFHFVQFSDPNPPVRERAANIDLCPKNIDMMCRDLPMRYDELQSAGYQFRSKWVQYHVEDMEVREVQMGAHDDVNLVLVELLGKELPFTTEGYTGLTSFITVVPDADAEEDFYESLFDLSLVSRHHLKGPEIEKMIGLPPGSALDMRLFGTEDNPLGRVELIQYEGVKGANLYPLAKPGALGSLHSTFFTASLDKFVSRAEAKGIEIHHFGHVETILGSGAACAVYTPAGMRIEVHER